MINRTSIRFVKPQFHVSFSFPDKTPKPKSFKILCSVNNSFHKYFKRANEKAHEIKQLTDAILKYFLNCLIAQTKISKVIIMMLIVLPLVTIILFYFQACESYKIFIFAPFLFAYIYKFKKYLF